MENFRSLPRLSVFARITFAPALFALTVFIKDVIARRS